MLIGKAMKLQENLLEWKKKAIQIACTSSVRILTRQAILPLPSSVLTSIHFLHSRMRYHGKALSSSQDEASWGVRCILSLLQLPC